MQRQVSDIHSHKWKSKQQHNTFQVSKHSQSVLCSPFLLSHCCSALHGGSGRQRGSQSQRYTLWKACTTPILLYLFVNASSEQPENSSCRRGINKARVRRGGKREGQRETRMQFTQKVTHTHTQYQIHNVGGNSAPTPGPNNMLLYQRFIVNQLAEAAGVCEVGASREQWAALLYYYLITFAK